GEPDKWNQGICEGMSAIQHLQLPGLREVQIEVAITRSERVSVLPELFAHRLLEHSRWIFIRALPTAWFVEFPPDFGDEAVQATKADCRRYFDSGLDRRQFSMPLRADHLSYFTVTRYF
ncbi:hypothetical protein PENTCL1PPCAC_10219, partial [Pristionchus entomophagus]